VPFETAIVSVYLQVAGQSVGLADKIMPI